jgi:hypothetical protein
MALEDMDWPEESKGDLIKAMGAYCGGLHEGLACGALCAANSALWLAEEDYDKAHDELGPEMMSWFKDRFGSWNCADILDGDVSRKQTFCPTLVADTYLKLLDMLEDIGAVG